MTNRTETELILIRHGETQWNIEGRWQGHFDSPLTETGIRQAKAVARRLSTMSFSALYSSDLGRAVQTATIISEATGHEVITDKRLRERNVGVFQGLTLEEMRVRFPEEFDKYRMQRAEYVIPKGESALQRAEINIGYLTHIAENHPGECIVAITHGGVLNNMFRHVLQVPPESSRKYKLFNAAINSFAHNSHGWALRTWGDISHYSQPGVLDEVQV